MDCGKCWLLYTHTQHTHIIRTHILCHAVHAAIEGESFNTSLPVCPNVRAIFNCTVCESKSHSTYWRVGNYSPCVLYHSFPGRDDRCELNNTFVAKLRPADDCYSSTFNITAFPSLSGSMVRCYVQVPGIAGRGQLERGDWKWLVSVVRKMFSCVLLGHSSWCPLFCVTLQYFWAWQPFWCENR